LNVAQFTQFVLLPLMVGRRGSAPKLSLHAIFNYLLRLLYMGCQWKNCRSQQVGTGVLKFITR